MTRAKLKALLEEYGRVAVWTYLVIWMAVLGGFAVAISAGFEPSTAKGDAGALISAWVATKLTQPLRIVATLGLTPLVARVVRGLRAKSP